MGASLLALAKSIYYYCTGDDKCRFVLRMAFYGVLHTENCLQNCNVLEKGTILLMYVNVMIC